MKKQKPKKRAASKPAATKKPKASARKVSAKPSPNKSSRPKAARAKAKPTPKARAKTTPKAKPKTKPKPKPKTKAAAAKDWVKFVADHGVVLASARGPVPSVAEAIAGEPIVGSWWSHPKARAIFNALCAIDDSADVRCFKLIDGKVTFVHRSRWPALVKLADAGVLAADRVASIEQEHLPDGEHRNFTAPYPEWVKPEVAAAAAALTVEAATAQLGGGWI